MRAGGFLFLFSGWVHSWIFGFVWQSKIVVVLLEVSKMQGYSLK